MKYSEFKWNETGLAIIFGGDAAARSAFCETFAATHRNYRTSVLDILESRKKGFLQKDPIVTELLIANTPRAQRAAFQQQLNAQMGKLGLDTYQYRKPYSMANGTRYLWSVLADALWGNRCFLISDDGSDDDHATALQTVKWLMSLDARMSVVWFTGCSEETFYDYYYYLDACTDFWRAEQGGLTRVSRAAIVEQRAELRRQEEERKERLRKEEEARQERLRKEEEERRARLEAEMQVEMDAAAKARKEVRFGDALEIYESLIAKDWVPAMEEAAKLYMHMLGKEAPQKQIERGTQLCLRARTSECWLLLAERSVTSKQGLIAMGSDKLTQEEKEQVVQALTEAAGYYKMAVEAEATADALYKAALFHLRYAFHGYTVYHNANGTQNRFGENYTHDRAIPYIKRLIALCESTKDRKAIGHRISLAHASKEYYTRAEQEYRAENNT